MQIEQGEEAALMRVPATGIDVVHIAQAGGGAQRGVAHHQGDQIRDSTLIPQLYAAA
ncbi:hypothetical protein D3C75_1091520 [compost metagenome]